MFQVKQHISVLNLSIGIVLIWGIWIANPQHAMFLNNRALYEPMRELYDSEMFWGGLWILISLTAGALKYLGDSRWGSFVMGIMSLSISMLFIIGDTQRPAWAIFLLVCIFNLIEWRSEKWTQTQR